MYHNIIILDRNWGQPCIVRRHTGTLGSRTQHTPSADFTALNDLVFRDLDLLMFTCRVITQVCSIPRWQKRPGTSRQEECRILTKNTSLETCNDFPLHLPLPARTSGSALLLPERVCALAT